MSVTITLDDPLAGQLRSEAQQQRVSVQELAVDLLARALADAQDVVWRKANLRRLALIHKSSTLGLTPPEVEELQQLQVLADQFLEASDSGRLADVQRMEQEVRVALYKVGEP